MLLIQVSFFILRFISRYTLLFRFHMEFGLCLFLKCMFYILIHFFIYFSFQYLSYLVRFQHYQFIDIQFVILDFIINFSILITFHLHFLHFNFQFNYPYYKIFALHIHSLFQLILDSQIHCSSSLFHTISIRILHAFFIQKFDYYSFLLDPIKYYHLLSSYQNFQFLCLLSRGEEEDGHHKVRLDLLEILKMIDQLALSS